MAATTIPQTVASPTVKKKTSKLGRYKQRWGLFFISPWIIGFLLFTVVPMVASLYFTTLDFNLATPDETEFVGAENWQRALTDENVPLSFVRTFKLAAIMVPMGMGFSLFLALLLNSPHVFAKSLFLALLLNSPHVFAKNIFRTMFYAPYLIPAAATTLIWSGILNENTGWINLAIEAVTGIKATGPEGIRWLAEPSLINATFSMMGLWGVGNSMLINIAALQNVPTELYEASQIDGASWFQRLFRITLPMISPVIFYNMVLAVIGLMQYFLTPFVLNGGNGAPQGETRYIMVYFYKQTFANFSMGYGATIAWLIFIVALIFTLVLFGTAKYWVYYASEENN
jgi:multiple sugar transport system permease protein